MKLARILAVALTAAAAGPSLASAQAGCNTRESSHDNAQIISGKVTVERDRKEITAICSQSWKDT